MTVRLNPYLSFKDNARQAMEFYQSVFGGELTVNTFAEYQASKTPPRRTRSCTACSRPRTGSRSWAPHAERHGVQAAAGVSVSLSGDDEPKLRGYFDKLADGGTIVMPLEPGAMGRHIRHGDRQVRDRLAGQHPRRRCAAGVDAGDAVRTAGRAVERRSSRRPRPPTPGRADAQQVSWYGRSPNVSRHSSAVRSAGDGTGVVDPVLGPRVHGHASRHGLSTRWPSRRRHQRLAAGGEAHRVTRAFRVELSTGGSRGRRLWTTGERRIPYRPRMFRPSRAGIVDAHGHNRGIPVRPARLERRHRRRRRRRLRPRPRRRPVAGAVLSARPRWTSAGT